MAEVSNRSEGISVNPGSVVRGKSVAIVCNSPEILDTAFGDQIEAHDVVIRMNRGFPNEEAHYDAIGRRTDVLTGGKIHPIEDVPNTMSMIWWLKNTAIGNRDRESIKADNRLSKIPLWQMPSKFQDLLNVRFGYGSSSGPLIVCICKSYGATKVELFGLTCWGELEIGSDRHWWRFGPHKDMRRLVHRKKAEADWFREHSTRIAKMHYLVKQ